MTPRQAEAADLQRCGANTASWARDGWTKYALGSDLADEVNRRLQAISAECYRRARLLLGIVEEAPVYVPSGLTSSPGDYPAPNMPGTGAPRCA